MIALNLFIFSPLAGWAFTFSIAEKVNKKARKFKLIPQTVNFPATRHLGRDSAKE